MEQDSGFVTPDLWSSGASMWLDRSLRIAFAYRSWYNWK